MGSPERGSFIPISETKPFYTPEGHKAGPVSVLDKPKEPKTPNQVTSTGLHEGWHMGTGLLRGIEIYGADEIENDGAFGRTYPGSFDGPTAAAGHASGTGGYGYDFLIDRLHGRDPYADSAAATATIKQLPELPIELGWNLDKYKSLNGNQIKTIYWNVVEENKKRNKKTLTYEIPIKTKGGREETIILEVPKETTMLHVPLPPSGDIFVAAEREMSLSP